METSHKLSWGRTRDSGRAERFGLLGSNNASGGGGSSRGRGGFDMTLVVKLPRSEVIIGSEKAEWRRMHPAECAEMKAREQKDKELAAKDRVRKLVQQDGQK